MRQLKDAAMRMIQLPSFQKLTRFMYSQKTIILMYHGVCANTECYNDWLQVPISDFQEQMEYLAENFDVISMDDAIAGRDIGKRFPGPNIVITFDDGYANNYANAYPVLKRLGLPATIYLVSNYINSDKLFWYDRLYSTIFPHSDADGISRAIGSFKKHHPATIDTLVDEYLNEHQYEVPEEAYRWYRNLTLAEIKEMAESGLIQFGSHTHNHDLITKLSDYEARDTMQLAYDILKGSVPKFVPQICFPNGWYNPIHLKLASDIGYTAAIRADHQGGGAWELPETYDWIPEIPRWGIGRGLCMDKFTSIVSCSLQALRTLTRND